MEVIFKIIAIGLITSFAIMIVKPVKTEFAVLLGIVGGIIILIMVMNYLTVVFNTLNNIITKTNLNKNIFSLVLKIVGIGYLTEFAASLCYDCGSGGLADKMLFGGKIVLLVMSMPIVMDILRIVTELLPWKDL